MWYECSILFLCQREREGGGYTCTRERESLRVGCVCFFWFFFVGGGQTNVQLEKNNLRLDVEKQQMTSVLSLESLFSSDIITPLPATIAPY